MRTQRSQRTAVRAVVAAIAAMSMLSVGVPGALAQPADPPEGEAEPIEKPWAKGVPAAERSIATGLFKEGNGLLRDSFFVQAVEKYTEALSHWDHPSIHYNLAIALINVDKPLEVNMHLDKSLAYDAAALSPEELDLARSYKKLVTAQIVEITVTCDLPGAQVFIDGKEAFVAPGKDTRLVVAGEHTFSASKKGYETTAVTRAMPGGTPQTVELDLFRPEDLVRYKRKVAPWLPWAVAGGGFAVIAIGGLLHASALGDFDDFDSSVAACEEETQMACEITADQAGMRDGGATKQTIAVVGYVVGAAALVSGVVLVLINRPKPYRIDREQAARAKGMAVLPVLGPDQVGVSAAFRF